MAGLDALAFPKLHQLDASLDGEFHVLHGDPLQRAVQVMGATEQVRGRQAEFGEPRAVGAAANGGIHRS